MSLADDVLSGNRRALARLITGIENDAASAAEALAALFSHTGRAHLVGVTGAPGTGKSSLVNHMALALRRQGRSVAICAVDPTSPFSGGAILGDRIRMRDLAGDPGVFIRSMATRGSLGGLARATADVVRAMDAAGFDVVLIETVGAGQSEVDIARHAQTVLVVEAPGMGDDVQAIKAGILEIADVLVVNKSDDPRAQNTIKALRAMLDLGQPGANHRAVMHHGRLMEVSTPETEESISGSGWSVPIVSTNALTGDGVGELVEAVQAHGAYLHESGEMQRREQARIAAELERDLRDALLARLLGRVSPDQLDRLIERIVARELAPQAAVEYLLSALAEQ
jgi:LAO/AO transport system kinase